MKSKSLFSKLKKRLKGLQSESRFQHSLAVSKLAGRLGKRYGWDWDQARLAGLLHDYAKEWSPAKLRSYVNKHHLKVPDMDFILKESPNMLHAYVSADLAFRQGWIKKTNDLKAIRSHTLGAVNMSLEEKIMFVADFSAYGRRYAQAKQVRKLAKRDLEAALTHALELKMLWQLKKRKAIHPMPVKAWNQLVAVKRNR